jgi:hypothetical protein
MSSCRRFVAQRRFRWFDAYVAGNHLASVDPLGQRDDDFLRPAHLGHTPGVLVLTDPADQSVSVRSQAVDRRLEVDDLETDAAQTQSLAIAVGDPGSWSGLTKLASSTPAPPSGGHSLTISVRASAMPMTVSINSPSTNVRPSTSRPKVGEEHRHRVEVGDSDSDVVEVPDV